MKRHHAFVKVRYAETDQMGVVHHGNYAEYLEIARLDWLDQLGVSYKSLEKEGIMLPVYELNTKFIKPAYFDDVLRIETQLKELPRVKIEFSYQVFNQHDELITTAYTILVFMDSETKRPIRCPEFILNKIKN
ncbi:acyl-CoA thioesterase [Gillisia sp. Q332]|uniref:acyl-CoA thioesterase n=1 Tax=Gillisia xinjiangensis TaxID=3384765 RepID=UPI00391AF54D